MALYAIGFLGTARSVPRWWVGSRRSRAACRPIHRCGLHDRRISGHLPWHRHEHRRALDETPERVPDDVLVEECEPGSESGHRLSRAGDDGGAGRGDPWVKSAAPTITT